MRSEQWDAFDVAGLSVRTRNAEEMSGSGGLIGPLWGRFLGMPADSIPYVSEPGIVYSLYTHYETDENGFYDVVLGKRITGVPELAPDISLIHVPASSYLVFPAAGSQPQEVQQAWKDVYTYFANSPATKRAFTVDFDRYASNGMEIYIAVRS